MLYVCNLLRYFLVICFWSWEKRVYLAVCIHASSIANCFMGKLLMEVWTCISYSHLSRYSVWVVDDLAHTWYFRHGRW